VLLLSAAAAVTMVVSPAAGLLGALGAVLVGLARVYAGVHHLADVAGSVAIVGMSASLYMGVAWAWRRLRKPR
jgi:membrane-associated phospholipid phosphatase